MYQRRAGSLPRGARGCRPARTHRKYEFKEGNKIKHGGITERPLKEREAEHQRERNIVDRAHFFSIAHHRALRLTTVHQAPTSMAKWPKILTDGHSKGTLRKKRGST